jgi:tetratricopeptide (TPR) repeat protein
MEKQDEFVLSSGRRFSTLIVVLVCLFISPSVQSLPAQEKATTPPPQEESPPPAQAARELPPEERGDIFMARKQYLDAVDYYKRALTNSKDRRAAIWNKIGIAYQQQTQFGQARKAYKKAIRIQKDFPEPWNNLGTTFYLAGKAKKSLKYYRQAVKLNPNSASFHMNLGTAYFRRKKFEQAITEYRAALTLDPNILREHSARGTVVEARGSGYKLYFYLAKTFASLGMTEEAVRYLRKSFEEGFHDRELLDKDPDFQKISTDPAYVDLLAHPPVAIKE